MWRAYVDEFGDVKVQAEALGYRRLGRGGRRRDQRPARTSFGPAGNGGPRSTGEMATALRERQSEFTQGDAGELRAQIIEAAKDRE